MPTRNVSRKARHPIAADDVPRVFDDGCIAKLARIGKLPAGADMKPFAEGIREAARTYAREARVPNVNELHDEIAELFRAADRREYEQVARLLEQLSAEARDSLSERGRRIGFRLAQSQAQSIADDVVISNSDPPRRRRRWPLAKEAIGTELPPPDALRNCEQREEACAAIALFAVLEADSSKVAVGRPASGHAQPGK
jgi:hypothetical protein